MTPAADRGRVRGPVRARARWGWRTAAGFLPMLETLAALSAALSCLAGQPSARARDRPPLQRVAGKDDFVLKTRNAPDQIRMQPGQVVDIGWLPEDCRALDA